MSTLRPSFCLVSIRHVSFNANTKAKTIMKKTISHSHVTSTSASPSSSTEASPLPTSTAVPPGVTGGTLLLFLNPPPASANIPPVPQGFVPQSGATYRATGPKKAELTALPLAVSDLRKFVDFTRVIGSTAPPYEEVLQLFDVTNQWSTMRTSSRDWDIYCVDHEGICWRSMRSVMERLKAAFELAAAGDPSLWTKYAGLATFLGVKRVIAKKGVATRRLNKRAVAEGRPPVHGEVGKQRAKATAKAIVAAAQAAAEAPVVHVPATPVTVASTPVAPEPVTPVAVAVAPVANGAAPAAAPAAVVNGANGASH